MEPIDYALQKMRALVEEVKAYKDSIITEQDTRFKVINRVLTEVLGHELRDVLTESVSGGRYLDYQVRVNDIFRLIVEAKKESIDFDMDPSRNGRAYQIDGAVCSGKEMQDGINQTIYYAAQEGIELGCLTNGVSWIIFRANRGPGGLKPKQGKAIIFNDLEGIISEFNRFYDLLAPEHLAEVKFRAIFQEEEGHQIRTKDFAQSLKNADTVRMAGHYNTHYGDFERVMNTFFSRLSGDDDPEFLMKCFVETKESQAAEFQIARIAEEFISKVRTIETHEGERIREVIERIKVTQRQEFIVLVGTKGAGKSTFVERFFTYVLSSSLKDDCIIVKVNLASYHGSEKDLLTWLDDTLLEECEKTLYEGYPTAEEIIGIFFGEYNRLRKGNWRELYDANKMEFKIKFGDHIENYRNTRRTDYIHKLIGNIVRSRKKIPCIIFDNTDHFSIDIQERVFQYGRAIYTNELCLVMVPITDKTSWQLSQQGAIRSYENEVFYLPTPSPKRIIEKRIEYLDEKVKYEKAQKGHYFFNKGIRIEINDIEGFVRYLQLVFLHDPLILKWIGSLSNYDIRTCLEMTRDVIISPHLSMIDYLKLYVQKQGNVSEKDFAIKNYKVKNAIIKRNYLSYPVTMHPYVQCLYYVSGEVNTTPLLAVRILQLLTDRKNDRIARDSFLTVTQIYDYFGGAEIERSVVHKVLQFLLTKGLISSYDKSITNIDYSKSIELTPSGTEHYYWSINDLTYNHIMLEVTPITNRAFYKELTDYYYRTNTMLELTKKFLIYLEEEDHKYCRIPNHVSYEGQKFILKRFDWQKKLIDRHLKDIEANRRVYR